MRTLTAIGSVLLLATASGQQSNRIAPEPERAPDPLYHVEVILFEWVDGNRAEEDFFHGVDDPRHGPPPTLLQIPLLELESLYDPVPDGEPGDREPPPIDTASPVAESVPPAVAAPQGGIAPPADGGGLRADPLQPQGIDAPLSDALELIEPWVDAGRAPAFTAADEAPLPDGFRNLRADELELTNVSVRLDRRPYRLLGHAGWVQTGVDTGRAVAVDLARVGIVNPRGTIKVYRGTYLHAAVDLDFLDGRGTFWTSTPGFGGLTPLEYARRYRLETEHNAFRSDDLVAIDHPLFGVLIRVTEAPEPEDETETGSAGRPAG